MTRAQTFRCDVCHRQVASLAELEEHAAQAHEAQVQDIRCPVCGTHFETQDALQQHTSERH